MLVYDVMLIDIVTLLCSTIIEIGIQTGFHCTCTSFIIEW